jgi:putative ABC transport system permease protein
MTTPLETGAIVRRLLSRPAFSLTAVVTLTVGIGATMAIFSVSNSILLRPLAYAEPASLVEMWEHLPRYPSASVSYPNYQDWRSQSTVFEDLAAFRPATFNLTGSGEPVELPVYEVSASLFSVLGVAPMAGRVFTAQEDRRGAPPVVVLSYGLWLSRFGGDESVIGREIVLDGYPGTVIGVMPPTFFFPPRDRSVALWVPLDVCLQDSWLSRTNHPAIEVLGRVKAGVGIDRVRAEMDTIARRLEKAYPDTNTGSRVNVVSLTDRALEGAVEPLHYLLAASILVLLIACANVATLLLAQATLREREMAVRSALGASPARLVRLSLVESLVLWVLGGLGGIACAWLVTDVLATWLTGTLPRAEEISCDLTVTVAALVVTLVSGSLFGLIPALRGARPELVTALKEGGWGVTRPGRRSLRRHLVLVQVALATVLGGVTCLTLRSYAALTQASPGLEADNVLTVMISLPENRYPEPSSRHRFFTTLLESVRAMPRVVSAAAGGPVPLAPGGWQSSYTVEGEPPPQPNDAPMAEICAATADFHRTLGIPLLRGRALTDGDGAENRRVMVVDERLANRHWPGQDPIGKRVLFGGQPWEVIGVAGHVKNRGVQHGSLAQIYIPFERDSDDTWTLLVRVDGDPGSLVEPIRQAVLRLDPSQPLSRVVTMRSYLDATTAGIRFVATLLLTFAAAALLLVGVAVYGVVAGESRERRHEVAIRMALGAGRGKVLRMVVLGGLRLVARGAVVGLPALLIIAHLLRSRLYGVAPADPLSLLVVGLTLLAVATVAAVIPARRAARLDPLVMLRSE